MIQNLINGVPTTINGDRVVYFTNSKKIKMSSFVDSNSLFTWYQENPMDNHMGLLDLFSNTVQVRVPIYTEIFKNKQILEVNGMNGRFTYDLPVKKSNKVTTTEDTSDFSDVPGIDGSVFPLILNTKYTNGDILTFSRQYGLDVIVSEDYDVEEIGSEAYRHWVKLADADGGKWFPADMLKAGVEYFKNGHSLGEYSTQYSGLEDPGNMGTLTNEFILGNHRGVETSWTMYADKKNFGALEMKAADFYQSYLSQYMNQDNDMFVYGQIAPGASNPQVPNIKRGSATVGSTLEFLALAEYVKLEAHQLLFGKAAVINEINGTKRINEGLWRQWRRGRLIKYSKPNGITENHIREAASYIFQSRPDLQYYDRKLKFKCGWMAYQNMLALFEKWVVAQVTGLSLFMGADRPLPQNPIKGSSLTDLSLSPVVFTEVPIPGIGMVQIEHDPSLDYMEGSDRFVKGFNDYGYADTTYSMVIYDASSNEYSNARQNLPAGTTLVEGGNKGSIYYVKPEGDNMYWGYENGRYAGAKASDIVSSLKTMSRSFWVHGASAIVNLDPSKTIIIELKSIDRFFN